MLLVIKILINDFISVFSGSLAFENYNLRIYPI